MSTQQNANPPRRRPRGTATPWVSSAARPSAKNRAAAGDSAPLVVWKFGGTSVADHDRLRAVAERLVAARREGNRVVAVLSAMGKSTDELSRLAYQMSSRPQLRELDALLSVGENISCALASIAVHELGERAVSLTGPQAGVLTDETHGNARLRDIRPQRILDAANDGAIVLVTGFQGVSSNGDVTTLGRGGSDASAVAIAAALGVRRCEIFTDVPAVFTADPRVVPDARPLRSLGRDAMLELAEAGAGVLQPRAVELAAAHDVDIHVRSSFTTEPGSWIRKENPVFEDMEVAGVAHRHHERLYSVRDLSPAAVSAALARRGAAIGAIVRHGNEVRFSAPGVAETEVVTALDTIGARITTQDDLGTVSVVSTGIGRQPDIMARALTALERSGIEPELVTSGPSRVSCHIPSDEVDNAVRLLHKVFRLDAIGVDASDSSSPIPGEAA